MVREEIEIKMPGRTLIYESCSHGEAIGSQHTLVFYIRNQALKYFKLKRVKEMLVGKENPLIA